MRANLGPMSIEAGTTRVKVLGVWLPDGLHIWLGRRGAHLFWHHSPHMPRVTFDIDESEES